MLRKWLAILPIIIGAVVAAASSGLALGQADPIRVGFLTVRTGPLAAGGRQMEDGIQLFLKERNYTIAGRKVELIIADTGGNPVGAKTKTQELVERSKVHVIIGPLATFEAIDAALTEAGAGAGERRDDLLEALREDDFIVFDTESQTVRPASKLVPVWVRARPWGR